ncbi:MAG: hypothetical protein AAFR81_30235 [Chloroflexota bacterium]
MARTKKGGGEVAKVIIDNGNGNTEGVKVMDSGRHVYASFASMRAEVSGDDFDDDFLKTLQSKFDYADWNDSRYTYGSYCLGMRGVVIDRHQGVMRYGNPMQQFLIDVACAKLKVNSGDKVELTVLIPPGHFNEHANTIKQRLTQVVKDENTNKVTYDPRKRQVQLRDDKNPRKFKFVKVEVRPELIGALLCFAIDRKGRLVETSELGGVVYGLDGGMHTLDILEMRSGAMTVNNLGETTIPDRGIYTMILLNVLRQVKALSPHFEILTPDHLDAVLRKGMQTGGLFSDTSDWTLHFGVTVDLKPIFKKWCQKYAEFVANRIIDERLSSMKGVDKLVLFGGFAELVSPFLKDWYDEDRIRVINEFESTSDVTPLSANMEGYARLSQVPPEIIQELQAG